MALKVLRALDVVRTQQYHFTAILIAGLGFFTDAYDLFATISVTNLLGRLYYFDEGDQIPGRLPQGVYAALTAMAYCGAVCGQLFFGWAGDKLGRRKVYGITLTLMMISSINCGLSFGRTAKSVITTLCFFRFWIGFGIGGDYPLSATIMSEYSNTKTRGAFVAAVFAMQGLGILVAAAVTVILTLVFKAAIPSSPAYNDVNATPPEADFLWRAVFMIGALPAALTFYFRMRMPETARYTALVLGQPGQATKDMQGVLKDLHIHERVLDIPFQDLDSFREPGSQDEPQNKPFGLFSRAFVRRHGKELLGVTVCWFFVDVVFYSLNLYQKDMFTSVRWLHSANDMSGLEETLQISRAQALIAIFGTVPGYWVTVVTIDRMGRKPIQLMGFAMMTVFMVILAADFTSLHSHPSAFVAMYALTFFFANWGPNATTFVIPAELFPARLRTTCNGIAAAAGKMGAIVAALGIVGKKYTFDNGPNTQIGPPTPAPNTQIDPADQIVLGTIAICNCIGFCFTFLLPETNGKSLEALSDDKVPESSSGREMGEELSASISVHDETHLLGQFGRPSNGAERLDCDTPTRLRRSRSQG